MVLDCREEALPALVLSLPVVVHCDKYLGCMADGGVFYIYVGHKACVCVCACVCVYVCVCVYACMCLCVFAGLPKFVCVFVLSLIHI